MKILFITILLTIVILFGSLIYIFKKLIKRAFSFPRVPNQKTPSETVLNYQEFIIPVTKKSNLETWYIFNNKMDPRDPLIIGIHGWRETCSSLLPIASELVRNGWRCLLINARNHGKSGSVRYSTMVTFQEDIQAAIDYALSKITPPVQSVVCLGHSVGAASSLYAAVRNPRHIKGVVSIASFVDLEGNIRRGFINKLPARLTDIVMRFLELEIGERLSNLTPENTIGKLEIPILLLHGENDRYATPEMMNLLNKKNPGRNVEAELIPGDHRSLLETSQINQRINDFLSRRFTRVSDPQLFATQMDKVTS